MYGPPGTGKTMFAKVSCVGLIWEGWLLHGWPVLDSTRLFWWYCSILSCVCVEIGGGGGGGGKIENERGNAEN